MSFASFSETGPREFNEDRVLTPAHEVASFHIAAVADGIGGAPGGGEAAAIAIEAAAKAGPDPMALPSLFPRIVERLSEASVTDPSFERMGTTLSMVLLHEGNAHVAHVGDSRIYHLRGRGLVTLSEDQTEVAALVKKGVFTDAQAKRYPRRNVLLSALTPRGEYELQQASTRLEIGDRILLMTDGVHQRVTRGQIARLSSEEPDLGAFVDHLKAAVEAAKPSDNYTVCAVQIVSL